MQQIFRTSMFLYLAGLPLFASAALPVADVPSDRVAFTGYAEAKLQPEISTVPVSATGTLTLTIGPIKDDLSQLYDSCQAKPEDCDGAIHQHALDVRRRLGLR